MKTKKLYTMEARQPDGTWVRDEMPVTMREARERERLNRIIGGISTRITDATPAEIAAYNEEMGVS